MKRAIELRLFVAGAAPHSSAAMRVLNATLQARAELAAKLEIVDVLDEPERALEDRVLVTPTLVRVSPPPEVRVIGSLSDVNALLALLDAKP